VTHHWGARVDGWFASVDETIGTELAGCQSAVVLHTHRVLCTLGAQWHSCVSHSRSPYRILQQGGGLRAVPWDILHQRALRQ
jgi:hypothetical protein